MSVFSFMTRERIRPFDSREGLDDPLRKGRRLRLGDQVDDHLGVAGRLEDCAVRLQLVADESGVRQVAVVRERQAAERVVDEERLDVLERAPTGRRVPVVADGKSTGKPGQAFRREDVRDQPHRFLDVELFSVGGDDPSPLLPAVLKGVEPQVRHVGRFRVAVDAEDAALFPELVQADHSETPNWRARAFLHASSRPATASDTSP